MIKIEKVDIVGFEPAIRGLRNPKNSWGESDSFKCDHEHESCMRCPNHGDVCFDKDYIVGNKDHHLMQTLADAGTDHGKYLRMIVVYADVTAPLYWWKEADTYRMGVEKNSCSTMHKIHSKEFAIDDFSHDRITDAHATQLLLDIIDLLNEHRKWFNVEKDAIIKKDHWWNMIQMLPSSYNQKRTCMMSYAALKNIYHARKNHKLDEWRELCRWIESLPYSELITGGKK